MLTHMLTYADLCGRMLTYAVAEAGGALLGARHDGRRLPLLQGTQFTCFTSTKVHVLTNAELLQGGFHYCKVLLSVYLRY
jgi:hypothetical protein